MSHAEPVPLRAASPEDVLEILRDNLGHHSRMNFERDPWTALDFDTPLIDWADEYELAARADELGRAMNQFFGVDIPADEWERALDPVKTSTLRPLCETVARHLQLPAAEPAGYLGTVCREAGAFLTLRAMLHRAGVPVAEVRPSTALSHVALDHFNELLDSAARLAPGVLPSPVLTPSKPRLDAVYRAMARIGGYAFLLGLLPMFLIWVGATLVAMLGGLIGWFEMHTFAGSFAGNAWVLGITIGAAGTCFAGWVAEYLRAQIPLTSVTFKDFETFGDLARAVAAYAPPASSA